MTDELLLFAADLAGAIGNDEVVFTSDTISAPPIELSTSLIVAGKLHHHYGTFRVDGVQMFASKEAYRALGMLSLAILLHRELSEVHLHVKHPKSDVRHIIIGSDDRGEKPGLNEVPISFVYHPAPPASKHPWARSERPHARADLPHVSLTNLADCVVTEEEWLSRDTVRGFGTARGCALLAELFLNISLSENPLTEIVLEQEPGFCGVAPGSAELRIWLPGNGLWEPGA